MFNIIIRESMDGNVCEVGKDEVKDILGTFSRRINRYHSGELYELQ